MASLPESPNATERLYALKAVSRRHSRCVMSVLYVYLSKSEHKVKHKNMNTINHKYLQYNKQTIYKYYTTTNPIVQV